MIKSVDKLMLNNRNNTSLTTPPTRGMVTRVQQMKDASNSISTYTTYDTYGNVLTGTDGNGNMTKYLTISILADSFLRITIVNGDIS
jgi:hypothetical protein